MQLIAGHTPEHLSVARELFVEYASALDVDLCFQGFERELAELPGRYAPPTGRLILAIDDAQPAGCGALRDLGDGVCEMKRLYVRPRFRRQRLGRRLSEAIIAAARAANYKCMRLDTLESMHEAISLYESLGFRRIPAYYDNPSGLAVYLELKLA